MRLSDCKFKESAQSPSGSGRRRPLLGLNDQCRGNAL